MYKCKQKSKALKGYMTLEASFIMPWVIFLFVFLFYASFYLYDKCVLFQDAYVLVMRGSVQKVEAEALEYVNGHMDTQFGNKYFGVGRVEGKVKKTNQEIKVIGSCSVKMPFNNFLTLSKESSWQISTQATAQIINPTKVIRKFRIAENIIKKAGG